VDLVQKFPGIWNGLIMHGISLCPRIHCMWHSDALLPH
jgi:hypothetical protein